MWSSFELNDKLDAYNTASFIFYPYPKTALAEYSLQNGYLTKEDYDKIIASAKSAFMRSVLRPYPISILPGSALADIGYCV